MNKKTYFMFVHRSEKGGLWCEFPDFFCCMTDGENLEDLMKNAADALESVMSAIQDDGKALPVPSDMDELQAKAKECEDDVLFVVPVTGYIPGASARINTTGTEDETDEITAWQRKSDEPVPKL